MYRQGDVYLMPTTDEIPATEKVAVEHGRVILARGEATGHHHSIAATPQVAMFRPDDLGAARCDFVLRVDGGEVRLEHQEHPVIVVPPGQYRVIRQRRASEGRPAFVAD